MPTDRPIIFSAPMVRALLDGRKTMTRRLAWTWFNHPLQGTKASPWQKARPGDRLWVREHMRLGATSTAWCYAADDKLISLDWPDHRVAQMVGWAHHQERASVPSIHMPRWASRLTLTVTAARIERLKEISEADARAEGTDKPILPHWAEFPYRSAFRGLWNELHGDDAWHANPEVVAISFRCRRANIDQMPKEVADVGAD